MFGQEHIRREGKPIHPDDCECEMSDEEYIKRLFRAVQDWLGVKMFNFIKRIVERKKRTRLKLLELSIDSFLKMRGCEILWSDCEKMRFKSHFLGEFEIGVSDLINDFSHLPIDILCLRTDSVLIGLERKKKSIKPRISVAFPGSGCGHWVASGDNVIGYGRTPVDAVNAWFAWRVLRAL